jgi:hypothetical protein
LDISLAPEIMTHSIPDATSPPSINQEVPSVFHPVPFRFSFDPPSDPTSVSAFARAYPDLPGYHMWSIWDRLTAVSTSGPAGSEEEDNPGFSWDFSGLRDPSAMRDFMSACDYCLSGHSNDSHSLDDEGYDPSHECFHIDQGDHDEDNHLGMPGNDDAPVPASRVDIPRELAVVRVPTGLRAHSSSNSARCRPSSTKKQGDLCSFDKTLSRSGQAEHSPEERVIGPRTSSAVSLTMPGQGCPGLQRSRPEPSCSGDATSNNVGAIHHQGATYPGRTQGPPGKRRCPASRELCLPRARRPLGASCSVLSMHVRGLGPHRAHSRQDTCSPGSPRRRATPPRPLSPPRGEGAPRLPPQAWGTLRQ